MTLLDLVEIGGSLLILSAYAAGQFGRLDPHSLRYLLPNIAGSGVLAVIAAIHLSWGFLLLEATWAIVTTISLLSVPHRRRHPPDGRRVRDSAYAPDAEPGTTR